MQTSLSEKTRLAELEWRDIRRVLPAGKDGRTRRYEITFLDSTGKRRWKSVDGNLTDAVEALDEVKGRKRKGERVAPARVTLKAFAESWIAGQANLSESRGRCTGGCSAFTSIPSWGIASSRR